MTSLNKQVCEFEIDGLKKGKPVKLHFKINLIDIQ